MRNPKYNKGLAFSDMERDRLYLRGLLPPAILSQEVQAERALINLRSKTSDLDKHTYLASLQERNERLFYHVVSQNIAELLPIIHMPTVSLYCQKYGLMFRSLPRGLFISIADKGRVFSILKNWPERRVKAICLTDGERVGGLGDLGVNAIGVPISKLALYTACGGIPPSMCLPVCIDAGTDNEMLLNSQFYVGGKHKRVRGDEYLELVDEFLTAARRRFGNAIIHFEDMNYDNLTKLISRYRGTFPCFSDDVQGTAAVVLAGIKAAQPLTGKSLDEHTYLFVGEGPAGSAIAELLAEAIVRRKPRSGDTIIDSRKRMYMVDSKGLVCRSRGDSDTLEGHKLPYCHAAPNCPDLLTAVQTLKPSVLVGISSSTPAFPFTQQVCEAMAAAHNRPIILPLSQPGAEVTPEDAYGWTNGRVVFADRDRRTDAGPVVLANGQRFYPGSCQTAYSFPGIGLGVIASRATKLRDEMFIAAAESLAKLVTDEDRGRGSIYPPMSQIKQISACVARAVMQKAYDAGVATELPRPHDLLETAQSIMYSPSYRRYR
ncbi:hypothetical protein WJX72_011776 [[Myrmecia] bisecta]|uniref:Malic enzyme n=1 Tax=[Myrmecia] bisecta TaxID=41462 RepID=A0AAW1QCJ0_9CHLO